MDGKSRRKELREQYAQTRPEAAVYRILNTKNGRYLLGSTLNLASLRNRVDFARSTNAATALDHRLSKDGAEHGLDAFTLEVLEAFEPAPAMTTAQVQDELRLLEGLWREKASPGELY